MLFKKVCILFCKEIIYVQAICLNLRFVFTDSYDQKGSTPTTDTGLNVLKKTHDSMAHQTIHPKAHAEMPARPDNTIFISPTVSVLLVHYLSTGTCVFLFSELKII